MTAAGPEAAGAHDTTADADERMDEIAAWVREALDVPVALVWLGRAEDPVFSDAVGPSEPLVIDDARDHPLVRDHPAVADLDVVAYAANPITDDGGAVLGRLCAVDTVPRTWSAAELSTLRRIARACATELRLRLARHDAGQEGVRRDEFEADQQRALDRSQLLLDASQAFSATITVDDVRARIADLVGTGLRPHAVGTVVLDAYGRLSRIDDLDDAALPPIFDTGAATPSATAIREHRVVHYPNLRAFDAAHPPAIRAVPRRLGVQEVVAVPLPGPDGPVGALVLGWERPDELEPADLLTIASIAGYAGQAFARADTLRHRITVAHELQDAMLTTLPTVEGLELAARYAPADSRENVGGDWYDAAPVVDPAHPDERILAVSVGDVMGHTLGAAAIMGQIRSMLRQSAWDHPAGPPSAILRAFETANLGLDLGATGTAVVAQLCATADGHWTLAWSNAGHPPPVLLRPDGAAELLEAHDALFGFPFAARAPRTDHQRAIVPGSTLFLYTDGLVERRDSDLDAGIGRLVRFLRRTADRPVGEVVDEAVGTLAPDAPDDVVAFAIRVPEPQLP